MSARFHPNLGVLIAIDVAALILLLLGEPDGMDILYASFLVLLFTPVKGVTYRRLGGRRPFLSALAGTISWQIIGLPIYLDGFWPLIVMSFGVSLVVDAVALIGMRTVDSLAGSLALAVIGSAIVHLFTTGFFLFQRQPSVGVPVFVAGTVLFLFPVFYADRFSP